MNIQTTDISMDNFPVDDMTGKRIRALANDMGIKCSEVIKRAIDILYAVQVVNANDSSDN